MVIDSKLLRSRVSFSLAYATIFESDTELRPLLYYYFELVFRRKNYCKEIRTRLNYMGEFYDEELRKEVNRGFYLIPSNSVKEFRLMNSVKEGDSALQEIIGKYFYMDAMLSIQFCMEEIAEETYNKLIIPQHKSNVKCSISREYYSMIKERLSIVWEREVFLRLVVLGSKGYLFHFSKQDVREIIDSTNESIDKKTLYKKTDRFMKKILDGGLVFKYGESYSNASTQEKYMEWACGTNQAKLREDASLIRSLKNEVYKRDKEIETLNKALNSLFDLDTIKKLNEYIEEIK